MLNIPDSLFPKEIQRKRVIVFVDGNHVYHRMENEYGTHALDIKQLAEKLCTITRQLIQIRYYYTPFKQHVNSAKYKEQQMYLETIKRIPNIELIPGKYIKKPIILSKATMAKISHLVTRDELTTYVEKGVDVNIAVDMIHLSAENQYDDAILLSGDSDFVPAITQVRKNGKRVQTAAFRNHNNSCYDLINASNSFLDLHHYIPSIIYPKKAKEP
jgi:uncharacterized LabA/DUF88 family protein